MPQLKIDLAKRLGIKSKQGFSFILVKLGETVEEGTVLAAKKSIFGKKEIKAPFKGKAVKYQEDEGILVFAQDSEAVEKIKERKKQPASEARGEKLLRGEFGFGQAQGEILYQEGFDLPKLDHNLTGKILLIKEGRVSPVLLYKMAALGVRGLICGPQDEEQEKELMRREKSFEGFSLLSVDWEKVKLEKVKSGEKVILNGKRKGVFSLS